MKPDGVSWFVLGFLAGAIYKAVHMQLKHRGNARLIEALRPFARMHRPGSDPKELACRRGIASDMTVLMSGDFERAARVLEECE